MNLKGIIDIDFVNYKKTSMVLEFPKCNFKCDKECGKQICQNSSLASAPTIFIQATDVIQKYLDNPVTQAVVMQGLEPFDSLNEMYYFIQKFREVCDDDIVIYTGYKEEEIYDDIVIYTGYKEEEIYPYLDFLKSYKNIIIKFGRFIPDDKPHRDTVLGVNLASSNQYAKKIS